MYPIIMKADETTTVRLVHTDNQAKSRNDYKHGCGWYVRQWWSFLERRIRGSSGCGMWPLGNNSRWLGDCLRQEQFDTIPDQYVRVRAIMFTNEYYLKGINEWVEWPDFEVMRTESRNACRGCPVPGAWNGATFTCQTDCEGFSQIVGARVADHARFKTGIAVETWESFLQPEDQEPISPSWLKPKNKIYNEDIRTYRMKPGSNQLIPI